MENQPAILDMVASIPNEVHEGVQENVLHSTQQNFATLPPPSKVVRKAFFSNPNWPNDRQQCMTSHRAAVYQIILIKEAAQWQAPSEQQDSWMWDMESAIGQG